MIADQSEMSLPFDLPSFRSGARPLRATTDIGTEDATLS